jgi:hypothetical protein
MEIPRDTVKIKTIRGAIAAPQDFVRFVQSRLLRCWAFHPVPKLEEALASYGHIEIYTDGIAKQILDNSALIGHFVDNQKRGLDFATNLKDTFRGQVLLVLQHEDGPLAFLASQQNIREAKKIQGELMGQRPVKAIHEVMALEIGRDHERPERPTLDDIEFNILGDTGQFILADLLLEDVPVDKEDLPKD